MSGVNVAGDPKGEPRPRAFARGGRAAMYAPKTAHAWKEAVRAAYLQLGPHAFEGPVRVELEFRMRRPLSHHVANKRDRPLRPEAPTHHTAKPDVDNLAKAVLDALGPWPKGSDALAWTDDSIVAELSAAKRYANPGEEPGCHILIRSL